jgi:Tfp pilus assembly protein PilN
MQLDWVIIGFFCVSLVSLAGFALALRAAARLGQLLRSLDNLDWESLADLSTDVQKLKKQVQRYRNDENAQMKSAHKSALEYAAAQALAEQSQQNVTNIRGG